MNSEKNSVKTMDSGQTYRNKANGNEINGNETKENAKESSEWENKNFAIVLYTAW